jgi:hypothetical protein
MEGFGGKGKGGMSGGSAYLRDIKYGYHDTCHRRVDEQKKDTML